MKIEVLYVPGCPHHPAAVRKLSEVLASEGVAAEIRELAVTDSTMAEELRFYGSPTIRINGRDIAGECQKPLSFALACRLYPGAREAGIPPADIIHRAVREAREGENQ